MISTDDENELENRILCALEASATGEELHRIVDRCVAIVLECTPCDGTGRVFVFEGSETECSACEGTGKKRK